MMKNKLKHLEQRDLAERLREIREELYGKHGAQFLADALGIRSRPG